MKLSELIKQLQEIQKEYEGRKIEVIIVNDALFIREITEDSDTCHSAVLIEIITIE